MPTTDPGRGGPVADSGPALSIVVPAFNESHRLERTLPSILALTAPDRELIFVDDGSTDDTHDRLHDSVGAYPGVQVVGLPENRGKGAAIRAGVARASGRDLVFMDADLATDLERLDALLAGLQSAEIAIGSRAIAGAVIEQSTKRRSQMGHAFNSMVRASTGLPFRDTQCGFKAFRNDIARLLFHVNEIEGFAFDAVVLAAAQQMNLGIVEVPVRWREVGGTHVRPYRDPMRMALDVLVMRRFRRRGVLAVEVCVPATERPRVSRAVAASLGAGNPVVIHGTKVIGLLPFSTHPEAQARVELLRERLGGVGVPPRVLELSASETISRVAGRDLLVDQFDGTFDEAVDDVPSATEERSG